jgi:hypothetical protein
MPATEASTPATRQARSTGSSSVAVHETMLSSITLSVEIR